MSRARLFFHISLGSLFVPVIGIPLALTLALIAANDRSVPAEQLPSHRRWTRALFGLVALDTVLAVLLVLVVVRPAGGTGFGGGAAPGAGSPFATQSRRAIGVHLVPDTEPPRVGSVTEGGPAAKAGLRAGDTVIEVDGAKVSSVSGLQAIVREGPPGTTLVFVVERGGDRGEERARHTLELHTVSASELMTATPQRGLFEPVPGEGCEIANPRQRSWWFPAIGALVVFGLYAAGRRKGMDATLVYAGILLVLVALGASAAMARVCEAVGGQTRGGFLLSLLVQTVLLFAGGLWLWARSRKQPWWNAAAPADPAPPLPTAALGGWYMITGALRFGVLLLVVTQLLPGDVMPAGGPFETSPIHSVAGQDLGLLGALLFVVPVVIIGPIAEELVFRAAVLPWLSAWMSTVAALVVSASLFAVLHLYYGAFVVIILWYGVVLGWVRLRSGGMRAPIALHMTVNGVAAVVMLVRAAS